MTDAGAQVAAWRAVAAGWERQRAVFWSATRPVSERMLDRLDPGPGDVVLDLAAGAGDTGFLALPRIGPTGRLISTDVAPEMVEAARRRAHELGLDRVEFSVADAAALELPDGSVDGILCRFGLMLVVDAGAAAAEMRRVLRPHGRAVLGVWASAVDNPWISAVGKAAVDLRLVDPPGRDDPGPFRFADRTRLTTVLAGAGLDVVSVEDVAITWHAPSLDDWWDATRDTSRMLSTLLERVDATAAASIRAAAEGLLRDHVAADGSLAVPGLARVALVQRLA